MNDTAIRQAIAEACGWTAWQSKHGHWHVESPSGKKSEPMFNAPIYDETTGTKILRGKFDGADLPDYLNDLNAMHEAEKVLTEVEKAIYEAMLYQVCRVDPMTIFAGDTFKFLSATAPQRAEAFLRTLGLWE